MKNKKMWSIDQSHIIFT